jgi:uncharacterized repeat protein (TIGR01451 family)
MVKTLLTTVRALAIGMLSAAFITASSAHVQAVGAPGGCDTAAVNPITIGIRETFWATEGSHFQTGKYLVNIPAGWYNLYFGSWDHHSAHVGAAQTKEQWYVEGYTNENVKTFTSINTPDLPEDTDIMWGLLQPTKWVPQTDYIIAKHSEYPLPPSPAENAQSVQPVCVQFDPISGVDLAIDKHVKVGAGSYTEADTVETAPTAAIGDTAVWRIVLRNEGSWNASNIKVSDIFPAGILYQSYATNNGTFDSKTGIWSLDQLEAGHNAALEIATTITSSGTKTNFAHVSAMDGEDIDSPMNSEVFEGILDNEDIAIVKVLAGSTVVLGDSTTKSNAPTPTAATVRSTVVLGASTVASLPNTTCSTEVTNTQIAGAILSLTGVGLAAYAITRSRKTGSVATR